MSPVSRTDGLLKRAGQARRESRYIEFKSTFDVAATEDWCEIIKDLVAMANTGGGAIVVGCDNSGQHSGANVAAVLALDPAQIADKVHKYTETHFSDFEMHELKRGGKRCAVVVIGPAPIPMVFCQAGTYQDPANPTKQKTAFGKGTVFFRHGAKSDPGTTDDIRQAIDRRLGEIRKEWIGGVRKVVTAPPGSVVQVSRQRISGEVSPDGMPVRITSDPAAPVVGVLDYDRTHPYRQKDLISAVVKLVPKGTTFNNHDVQAIRIIHNIDPEGPFCHRFTYGGRQYSHSFAVWIAEQVNADAMFCSKTRNAYREYVKQQGHGPWSAVKKK
jgi:hypothetical protein